MGNGGRSLANLGGRRLVIDADWWSGRRVFVTGHTGFKGSWLTAWLNQMGAVVTGYSLEPDTDPSLFELLGLAAECEHHEGDILDIDRMRKAVDRARPQVVLHLAAQSLVRRSYREPLRTFAVNMQGTANLLELCREQDALESVVVVTTDKVYANPETGQAFPESAPLGGRDPYSASKAGAEIVSQAYRDSFFEGGRIATARSGNVIGGGDWSEDRLIPDAARAFSEGRTLVLRDPNAVRPWQHVLGPLGGYVLLAQRLATAGDLARGWNFGPSTQQLVTVGDVITAFAKEWGEGANWTVETEQGAPHEAGLLVLDSSRAREDLGWDSGMDFEAGIKATARWYHAFYAGDDVKSLTHQQLESHRCEP